MGATLDDLADLSADRLLQLGGLKERCSASLRCVAHGLALPCDLCGLEGDTAAKVVCDACGHLFLQGAPVAKARACESVAEFVSNGTVAFPENAVEALSRFEEERRRDAAAARLAAEAQQREEARQRNRERRRQLEAERRAADEEARIARELEAELRAAASAAERVARERDAAEAHARAEEERSEDARGVAERALLAKIHLNRAIASLWASAIAAASGAALVWSMPSIGPPRTTGYLAGYTAIWFLVWALTASTLYGKERTPAMRAAAPLGLGFAAFAWPALVGLIVCLLVARAEFTLKFVAIALVGGPVLVALGCSTCFFVGAALSMRRPWSTGVPADFRGLRSQWVWIGMALTLVVNGSLLHVKINGVDGWVVSKAPKAISEGLASASTPEASVRAVQGSPQGAQARLSVPVSTGYLTDMAKAIAVEDARYLAARLELLGEAGIAARTLVIATTGTEEIEVFARRAWNTWSPLSVTSPIDLLVVVSSSDRQIRLEVARSLNSRLTDQDIESIVHQHFEPSARKSGLSAGLRALMDRLDRVLWAKEYAINGEAAVMKSTVQAMGAMVMAISRWDGQSAHLPPWQQAVMDHAFARLESTPRPVRGDRKTARQLHAQGLSLIGQVGLEPLAVEKLKLAHIADPLDVQVVNDLAYAEAAAGQHLAALESLLKALRLAPTRTSAWVNLAQTVPFTERSPDEVKRTEPLFYLLGYYFSGNRAKTIEYLHTKAADENAKPEVRAGAANALEWLERLLAAAASNAPQTAAKPQ